MKFRVLIRLLCILLAGCTNGKSQPEPAPETAQPETTAAAAVIRPLPDTTMEAIDNAIVPISMGQGDFYQDESGNIFLHFQVYSYDQFDMVDISCLKAGDTILLSGEEIPVNTVECNDYGTVLINGGLDEGGIDLATDDSGIYYAQGYSDMKSWNLLGEAEYPVSEDFVFTDSANLDLGAVDFSAQDLLEDVPAEVFGFYPQNTTVRIEDGRIVAMERIYTP